MDLKDEIARAKRNDKEMQEIAVDLLSSAEPRWVGLKVVQWALTTDREMADLFADFTVREPGLVDISHFLNRAGGSEMDGAFCYARDDLGRPRISLTPAVNYDEDVHGPRYVTPAPYIANFDEFVAVVEAFEKTLEPETDGLTA